MTIDDIAEEIARIRKQVDSFADCPPECDICFDKAPYGDERNMWLGYHLSWYHRLGRKITHFFLV